MQFVPFYQTDSGSCCELIEHPSGALPVARLSEKPIPELAQLSTCQYPTADKTYSIDVEIQALQLS